MARLLLATKSAGKIAELRRMTQDSVDEWIGLDQFPAIAESPETGETFSANAREKALYYSAATGLPALADDSGLEVDALGGAPGVHSAYYAGHPRDDARNNQKLVADLRGVPDARRGARFVCAMALAAGGRILLESRGTVEGRIIDTPRGVNGFGYDPHFLILERGLTTAELSPDEKSAISHRGNALRAMLEQLSELRPSL